MSLFKINASPLRYNIAACLYLTYAQVRLHLESGMYPFTAKYIELSAYGREVPKGKRDYLYGVLNEMVGLGALVKGRMVIPREGLFIPQRSRKTWHLAGREALDVSNIARGAAAKPPQLVDVLDRSELKALKTLEQLDLQQRNLLDQINRLKY